MKTYPILKKDGSLHAFEITSAWLTFRPIYKVLRSVQGVNDIKRNWFDEDRILFNSLGVPFVVNEPWSDNSRYWIGPRDPETSTADISTLHQAFKNG
jgi:hypothetical protein